MKNTRTSKKEIFIACPLGDDKSDIREAADNLRTHIIIPSLNAVFGPNKYELRRSDGLGAPGNISAQIIDHLRTSDVVIADLTGLNPNVFYEVGVRHAWRKPCILLAQRGERLAFDIAQLRTIFYTFQITDAEATKAELIKHLTAANSQPNAVVHANLFTPPDIPAISTEEVVLSSYRDLLDAQTQTSLALTTMRDELLTSVLSLQNAYLDSHTSRGSYLFIEGEREAFSALVAATLRAKRHVRSTRFFSKAIRPKQANYADAICKRVLGSSDYQRLNHYSRIIAANNRKKLEDIEEYLEKFPGKPFTLYLTKQQNNFELVIIDDAEVFIHFHEKGSVIGSTLHIIGSEVAARFTSIFDRLHDPNVYPDVEKVDFKYISTKHGPKLLRRIREYFKDAPND